jgi:hypothetical protein
MRYFVLLLVVLAGCGGSPSQPDRVEKGDPFQLRVGESAVTTDDIRLGFDSLISESRCPSDVTCVRAGEAVIAISLSHDGGTPINRELDTTPARSSTTFAGFTITLTELQPYPRSGPPAQQSDYVATFVVNVR